MLCFVLVLHGCVWYVCCYVWKKAPLQCLELLIGGIWACTLVCVFLGFWDRDYVSQFLCVRYYVFVKSSFKQMWVQEGLCVLGACISLSGPCELLFFLFVLLPFGPEKW